MKTIRLALAVWAFCLVGKPVDGQSDLPSVETVFKQYQISNSYVSKSLKEKYLIENPSSCKFFMQQNASKESPVKSEWNVFKSNQGYRLNWRWPEDRATVTFKVTTPPNAEGVSYIMPLVVEYTRIKNGVFQNSWSYYSWHFGNPWQVKGGKEDALFLGLLTNYLMELEGHLEPYSRESEINHIALFTTIEKIEKSERPEHRESYVDKEKVIRQYVLTGETIEYDVPVDEEVIVKNNYTGSKGYIEVSFERSVNKTQRGDWVFAGFESGPGNKVEHGSPTGDKKLYKTAGAFGFKAVYQQVKSETLIPYFTDTYVNNYEKELSKVFTNLFLGKQGAEDELKEYIIPGGDDILKAFKDRAGELKNKFVELKPGNDDSGIYVTLRGITYGKVEERGKMTLDIAGVRKSYGKDKTLKKQYQDAGMSKEALSYFEGNFDYHETIYLKLVESEGQILINEIPVFNVEIKF